MKHCYTAILHWNRLTDGSYYSFSVRARKSEVLHGVGRWEEVTAMLLADLKLATLHGFAGEQARCLLKLGVLDAQKGDFAAARTKADQALERYKTIGQKEEMFLCRSTMLKIDMNLEQFSKAEAEACELLNQACREQNLGNQSEMLNNLGLICLKTNRWDEALRYLNRKLELTISVGDERGLATALGNIGGVYFARKQYDKAAECDRESIKISQRIGDIYSEYYALYNLAKAHQMMGRTDKALEYYYQDLKIARQLGDHSGAEEIINDIRRLGGEPV